MPSAQIGAWVPAGSREEALLAPSPAVAALPASHPRHHPPTSPPAPPAIINARANVLMENSLHCAFHRQGPGRVRQRGSQMRGGRFHSSKAEEMIQETDEESSCSGPTPWATPARTGPLCPTHLSSGSVLFFLMVLELGGSPSILTSLGNGKGGCQGRAGLAADAPQCSVRGSAEGLEPLLTPKL